MTNRICTIGGDGIGREVVPAAVEVLNATGLDFEFTDAAAGWECFERDGDALPAETLEAVRAAEATLFGAITSPPGPRPEHYRSPILTLRQELGLYANLRPARSWPVSDSRAGVDMLIVRENTEGLYVRKESRDGDTATAERRITRQASERIGQAACRLAQSRRQHLTIVHKANVLPVTCGLFRDAVRAVAEEYADLTVDEMLVDAMAMRLVKDPEHFDVIVTTNMFGDILSDEAAAICGGIGLAPSANIGPGTAVFEPVHGSAPDIAGQGIANPIATVLSASMMLDYLGEQLAAGWLIAGCELAMRDGIVTPDLGGEATTAEVTTVIAETVRRLREKQQRRGSSPAAGRPGNTGAAATQTDREMQCAGMTPGPSVSIRHGELEVIQDDGLLLEPLPEADPRTTVRRRGAGHTTRHHRGRRLDLR